MYYDHTPEKQRNDYRTDLSIYGRLSGLRSDSIIPNISSRVQENVFCYDFDCINVARKDKIVDAITVNERNRVGIGLKTFTNADFYQKVGEFSSKKYHLENLEPGCLIKKIATYYNRRIDQAVEGYSCKLLCYHLVVRSPNKVSIGEASLEHIDIHHLQITNVNKGIIYFEDGKHDFKFSIGKSTLFRNFDDWECYVNFPVKPLKDPIKIMREVLVPYFEDESLDLDDKETLVLPLYSYKQGKKVIPPKSGLNAGRAAPRRTYDQDHHIISETPRDPDEVYIPYPAEKRKESEGFFPSSDVIFQLMLPNGRLVSAKVGQENNKALMSNPGNELGQWLLREVFSLHKDTSMTYDILRKYNVDSLLFIKYDDTHFYVKLFNQAEHDHDDE